MDDRVPRTNDLYYNKLTVFFKNKILSSTHLDHDGGQIIRGCTLISY